MLKLIAKIIIKFLACIFVGTIIGIALEKIEECLKKNNVEEEMEEGYDAELY